MTNGARLKELIHAPDLLVMPGVYDPVSARVAELAGFDAVQCTGLGIAATTLGVPDYSIVSLSEMVERTRVIANAVSIPVMADADTGFGNAVNAFYTTEFLAKAGAAGLNIEDQVMPKRCGHLGGKELIETDEMTAKIAACRAAVEARDFVINARTDALAVEGIDGAIERANAYFAAGADMVYVDAVSTLKECTVLAKELEGPLGVSMVEGGRTDPSLVFEDLQEAGVARVSLSLSLLLAAVRGMQNVLGSIKKNRGIGGNADLVAKFDEIHEIAGMGRVLELEKRFL
uniref:isocitrate lyase/PEP mutase family protein n=1 Tax=Roseovarius indicus TaxID=540747 RepID=UPI003B5230DF